jgi:K(+)-stimulated pyrophosphate-energized sodium pump
MRTWMGTLASVGCRFSKTFATLATLLFLTAATALAQPAGEAGGGEAALQLPDLSTVSFLGMDGHRILTIGLLFCVFGLGFGLAIYMRLKNLPVHKSMLEVS